MAVMNGVQQWIFQRTANVLLVLFGLLILVTLMNGLTYESLTGLLGATWFKFFALIVLVVGCLNSILAGWQIAGDYARKFHIPNGLLMAFIIILTAVFFIGGIFVLF